MAEMVTLDNYRVHACTQRAVLVRHMAVGQPTSGEETWVPRSLCENGDDLAMHETDLVVAKWFCEKEGLVF